MTEKSLKISNHPAEAFEAPSSIKKGTPLKTIIDNRMVDLIAESFVQVYPDFNTCRFRKKAKEHLNQFELKGRARHIADALQAELPKDFETTSTIIIRSLGPELQTTRDYGLKPFFYLPHADLISRFGSSHFEAGMRANYELTKRFTSEFSVRSYIIAHRDRSLELLNQWTQEPNPHVRRLVSEGSRPRLPWAMRLKEIDQNPELTLPLLERLKDDEELYVRRSVANHLGDIGKANLTILLATCAKWLEEATTGTKLAKNRRWLIRHALRHPAKKGVPEALELRSEAAD